MSTSAASDPNRDPRYDPARAPSPYEERSAAKIERYEKALREIGLPKHVPEHFNREEFWKHLASKRSEIARDALGVTAEELILDAAE